MSKTLAEGYADGKTALAHAYAAMMHQGVLRGPEHAEKYKEVVSLLERYHATK